MKNISAIVKDLSVSQKSFYLIKEFNKYLTNTDLSACVFFERPSIPPVPTNFACKSVTYLSNYNGIAIATTIKDAEKILKISSSSTKYLYLWDMEWLEQPLYFRKAMAILRDPSLKIIARSESQAEAIENFCNKSVVGIVSDWNADQLLQILGD
tara:strand:+ start:3721 stop:4182 length:462 start_codon:yes stop_codon:yes gene_type:complete